ncbi:MAG: substrate-binding domain-containing protein, partial [Bacteroidales bacterium]|nr:substrate-binding domain-containing protein [Bacteroidales bacterium]
VNTYNYLRKRGIIESRHGKGFFVAREIELRAKRVFLLFDAMNSYKEILYKSFTSSLGEGYVVDIFFHYYNLRQFRRFIDNNIGDYNYYVVLPHFNLDVSEILGKIPEQQLILMDKDVPALKNYPGIFQDFENDVIHALSEANHLIKKYNKLFLVVGSDFQFIPQGIIDGFTAICQRDQFEYQLLKEINPKHIRSGEAYLVFTDNDLITIAQHAKANALELGKDIGLISYDDTPLKSVLANGITTITTDFVYMGQMAAKMIKEKIQGKFKNPSNIIIRNSL